MAKTNGSLTCGAPAKGRKITFLHIFMQFCLDKVHSFMQYYRCAQGAGWSRPAQKEKEMKLQIIALILQIITVVALVSNIVHHW